jgi:asparagine synthase (glutamine-hydrolysing)
MCGIAAIYAFHSSAPPVDREELLRIRDHMTARGPDAKGQWYSDDGRLGIGHRRLSIIDLSAQGVQPMLNARRNLVLSFNGEIYNYKALRALLEKKGRTFHTATDTEVILKLYEEQGEAMLGALRGMFSLVIWDAIKGKLLLARDPYGIKPLYYANDGWTIRIASQVKALLAGGRVSRQIDPAGHVGFFLFGSVPEPYTSYQEIREVPAGSVVEVDGLGPSAPRNWSKVSQIFHDARDAQRPSSLEEAKGMVREAVRDSVVHHLVSDVPVGAFLSAGVDSTAIVGLASEIGLRSIETLTLAFAEFSGRRDDEAPVAEQSARRYGTTHTTFRVSESEFRAELPKILEAMDQPTIDGINTWMVSKKASELGLKVCLSGLGGDELFGGYPSFRQIPRWVRAMCVPGRVPMLGRAFRAGFELTGAQALGLSPKTAGLVSYAGTYPGAYLLKRGIFMPWELPDIMGRELAVEGLRRLKIRQHIANAMRPDPGFGFGRVACLESSLYLRNQLLRDADWAGMAHSLEIRTPLVDALLLSRIAPVAYTRFMKSGKTLLAAAPAHPVEQALAESAKTGFSMPMERWVANLRDTLDAWRSVPSLARSGCHWARRVAYAIHEHAAT